MKRVLIVSRRGVWGTEELIQGGVKRGWEMFVGRIDDLVIEVGGGGVKVGLGKKDLSELDGVIFRTFRNKDGERMEAEAKFLAKWWADKGVAVIDNGLSKGMLPWSKMGELVQLAENGLEVPKSIQIGDLNQVKSVLSRLNFPVLAKHSQGYQGKNIYQLGSAQEIKEFMIKREKKYFFQEWLDISFDLRILILGEKIMGGIKRIAPPGDFRANVSRGAEVKKIKINEELAELALKAHRIMGYDFSGVDMVVDKGQFMVLEVNFMPQWKGFQEKTGVKVTKELLDFIDGRMRMEK